MNQTYPYAYYDNSFDRVWPVGTFSEEQVATVAASRPWDIYFKVREEDAAIEVRPLIQERVLNGAATLDVAVASNWRADINLTALNLNSECACVLGQTFGSYPRGAEALGFQPYGDESARSIDLGFMPDDDDPEGLELTAAWVDYLEGVRS